MTPDHINAGFELAAALIVWLNVRQVLRDRKVHGVHWLPIALFTVWGAWNCWYYPALGQTWSGAAAIGVTIGNLAWLTLVVIFWPRRPRPQSGKVPKPRAWPPPPAPKLPAVFRFRREPLNINSGADRP